MTTPHYYTSPIPERRLARHFSPELGDIYQTDDPMSIGRNTQNPSTSQFHNGTDPTTELAASSSLLLDDINLFKSFDRYVAGEIDQREFQAGSCKRLLFIWEWVFHLSFWNYSSALQTWYQILDREDVWLWVEGDEQLCPRQRLTVWWKSHKNSTDLHYTCVLSGADLGEAVKILKQRLESVSSFKATECIREGVGSPSSAYARFQSHPPTWRQRLDDCANADVRYLAVIWTIATSGPVRALDRDRRIDGRVVWHLHSMLNTQLNKSVNIPDSQLARWKAYIEELKRCNHTCMDGLSTDSPSSYGLHLTFELVEILAPQYHIHSSLRTRGGDTCMECMRQRPFFVSDLLRADLPTCYEMSDFNASSASDAPASLLRFLWWLWFIRCITKRLRVNVDDWLRWLALLPQFQLQNVHGSRLILHHLLSPKMDECIRSATIPDWLSQACFERGYTDNAIIGEHFREYALYIPTASDWETAKDILSSMKPTTEPGQRYQQYQPFNIRAVLGVVITWISTSTVTDHFPDIYTFCDVVESFPGELDCEDLVQFPHGRDGSLFPQVKARILNSRSSCCDEVYEMYLDWYLESMLLLVPEEAITNERVWRCRCWKTTLSDITRRFEIYLTNQACWGTLNETRILGVFEDLATMAKEHGVNVDISLRSKTQEREEEKVRLTQSSFCDSIRGDESAATAPSFTSLKASKSSQIEAIRTHLIDLLKKIELTTAQIPEILPRGNQKKANLPWKTLTQILEERGYEYENWPAEVPFPGSGSVLCDDNKGIHGLNAKHLRSLYDATRRKDRPLQFRLKSGDIVNSQIGKRAVKRSARGREEIGEESDEHPSKRKRTEMGLAPGFAGAHR